MGGVEERIVRLEHRMNKSEKILAVLCKKIDNGWAGNIDTTLNTHTSELHSIRMSINTIEGDMRYIKQRPRDKALFYKDIVLFITAAAAIVGIASQVFF